VSIPGLGAGFGIVKCGDLEGGCFCEETPGELGVGVVCGWTCVIIVPVGVVVTVANAFGAFDDVDPKGGVFAVEVAICVAAVDDDETYDPVDVVDVAAGPGKPPPRFKPPLRVLPPLPVAGDDGCEEGIDGDEDDEKAGSVFVRNGTAGVVFPKERVRAGFGGGLCGDSCGLGCSCGAGDE